MSYDFQGGAIEHDSFEEYVEWLEHEVNAKPEVLRFASKLNAEHDEEGKLGHYWCNSQSEDAVATDLYYLFKHGRTNGQYAHLVIKRARASQARVETMRRRKALGFVRDSQRQKLYDAETPLRKMGIQFTSIEEMQAYADKLLASAWWKRRYSLHRVIIRSQRNNCSALARGDGVTILMPKWAWCESILIHEITHHVTTREYGRSVAAHGREFAKIMLEIIRHKMGDEAWRRLKDEFRKRKVKHTLPRKPMSDEQRAAAADRLAAVRKGKESADA